MRILVGLGIAAAAGIIGAVMGILGAGGELLPGAADGTPRPPLAVQVTHRPSPTAAQRDDGMRVVVGFDDLPIDASLPAPWEVDGPGDAAVIALPTSVDRSVRLRSSAGGMGITGCLPFAGLLGPAAISRIGVDVYPGATSARGVALTLRSGDVEVFRLLRDPRGSWSADAGANRGRPYRERESVTAGERVPEGWARITAALDPDASAVALTVVPRDRAEPDGGDGAPVTLAAADLAARPPDMVCIVSPAEGPWFAFDNVAFGE